MFQAHLLSCTVHCLMWLQNTRQSANLNADDSDGDEEEEEGYRSDLHAILESMTRRMIKCELEDFELVCQDQEQAAFLSLADFTLFCSYLLLH